jgi:PTS system mannose-specific IID component/fructoselysine and glucoselysine-specific PTS system IID component
LSAEWIQLNIGILESVMRFLTACGSAPAHTPGGALKVIAAGMGIYFAQQGSLLGPILALLVYNLPNKVRWYGLKLGYRAGTTWLMRIYQSGLMDRVTYIASIVGLMVVGAMTASMIDITTPLSFAGQTS